eukprot:10004559-Heterocapsa_arctica.AAC.1
MHPQRGDILICLKIGAKPQMDARAIPLAVDPRQALSRVQGRHQRHDGGGPGGLGHCRATHHN